jgi:dephospho-CoA kinase
VKKVGITGGIGCGKSTGVAEFDKLGVPSFVADSVAAAYYSEPTFLADLHRLFGGRVFRADGSVDKQAIASLVFTDHNLLQKLNDIVHPRVIDDFDRFCSSHASHEYVLFESAILYDYGFDSMMDKVICVYLDLPSRLSRLAIRDGVGEERILQRISNQIPAEQAMMRADYVILNYEGNPRTRQVDYIDKLLRQ